ncbi:lipid II flippase MurJ [Fuscovulum ytuae]|uniref:Lipid II flippase MurJ n=1 Tax=Fuscovulum ytuae TaxID=3042299 RepID=A0ABY8Q424_9RHOB|nr:lipid II flippase MurJ [Fuscovulum sp. YMD61]WGV15408.1 lipid II flippase MurJ [Fuscovulum sp. YMD61]
MKSVLFASALVSFVLLLGRLSGFVRETLLAASFGPTAMADAAIVLLTLPDLMVGLLLAGGFNAVLIPAIKQAEGDARIALVHRTALLIGLGFLVLAGVLASVPQFAMGLLAPTLEEGTLPQLDLAFRLSLIALPIVGVIGVAAAYLNSIGRFAVPSLSVLLFNVTLCFYLLGQHRPAHGLVGFALAILLASMLRFGLHLAFMGPVLRMSRFKAQAHVITPLRFDFAKRFFLGVLGLGITVAAPVVFRTLSAATGEGNLALFSFALKLFELPSAILIAPVVIVMIPKLAAMTAAAQASQFEDALLTAIHAGVALALSAACVAYVFALPVAQSVYGYGAMGEADVEQVAQVTAILMLGLPGLCVVQLGAAALSAKGRVDLVAIWAIMLLCLCGIGAFVVQRWSASNYLALAAIGLSTYNSMLAVTYLSCLFGWRIPSALRLWTLIWLIVRCGGVIIPFGLILTYLGDRIGHWGGVGLALVAGVVLLVVNLGPLRALRRLQIDSE